MIENAELVMHMLEMYQMYKQQVPAELEEYLRYVAKTGNTLFQWTLVKPFIREKILNVIAEFTELSTLADIPPYPNVDPFNYEAMKTVLLERFDTFNGPPFTIQRLCELLSCPRKEYNRVDKFMRAVEKNILVVSTCELRSKREEPIVNGVPDRWENGKESDINMDMVNKNNVISDANVLNGNDTVESLLNELESMKTPETKLDEIKTEHKDHLVTQVADEVESKALAEDTKRDVQVLIADATQAQITDSSEVLHQDNIVDDAVISQTSIVGLPKENNSVVCEIQPIEVNEQITENSIKETKNLPNDINLESDTKTEDPIIEGDKLNQPDLIPSNTDRVEGSIIPNIDNKSELDITSQPEVMLEKPDKGVESMDVEVEDVTKIMESEVNGINIQKECTVPKEIGSDKQDDKSAINVHIKNTIHTEMDVESDNNENDGVKPETVSVNEEKEIKLTESYTINEVPPQVKDEIENEEEIKITESNTTFEEPQEKDEIVNEEEIKITESNTNFKEAEVKDENKSTESE